MKTKVSTMKTKARITLLGLVMVITLCYVNFASADSDFAIGSPATASVDLDFQIVIPNFIYFRVGTAVPGTVDVINFNPTATDVATPAAVTAGTGGDAGPGAVNVDVISNGGNITITEANNSGGNGLYDGTANYISYAQINTGSPVIPAPALSDAGGTTSTILSAGVTNLSDVWTYTYTNPATPPVAGTYGTAANGGRVTYTAAIP